MAVILADVGLPLGIDQAVEVVDVHTLLPHQLNRQKGQIDPEHLCYRVFSDYLSILQRWKERYPPASPDDAPDSRFTEACHMLEHIRYMTDLLATGTREERQELVADLMTNDRIHLLRERLQVIREAEHA